MPPLDLFLIIALMHCVALIVYAYIGYPVLVWVLARYFGKNETPALLAPDEEVPAVSLLIVAHNEEAEIEKRIQNALSLDYPVGRIEIVIASDGSTDRTNSIVRLFAKQGVRLLAYPKRRGKAAVLNDAFRELRYGIVVLSDANTSFNRESVHHLASWFADPSIGVVCGRLVLTDATTGRNVDGLYWKYETFLKTCESKLGALLGSNGGIYAIRQSLFEQIPENTIVDDFVIPLRARERTGCRIVYDRNAIACEETAESIGSEYHRRVRIGAGGFQSIGMLRGLLSPRHGWVSFTFWSHKILRWMCPFLMIGALLLNMTLLHYPIMLGLFVAQSAFYVGLMVASMLPARPRFLRVFKLGTMFTMMNVALLNGFIRWIMGGQKAAWKRTERSTEVAQGLLPPTPVEVTE